MIKGIMYDSNKIDERHTVDIDNGITMAVAIQINEDGTYERVMYMVDDERTFGNEVILDATEEERENYRKYRKWFRKGDRVRIVDGRKMRGEIKEVEDMFTYRPNGTYGHQDVEYLVFTDGTKVNKLYCEII